MEFLLSLTQDDPGYGSAEESEGQQEREIPSSLRQLHANSCVDREIALYDQKQIGQIERAERENRGYQAKDVQFFPPHSNSNPRTSLQAQRQQEYSKPLYQINEDFRRMSVTRNSHHAGHVRESLRSSSLIPHQIHSSNQAQHPSIGFDTNFDTKQLSKPVNGSRGQSSTTPEPSLRLVADLAASNPHSSHFLTPVQRKILTMVQIPHRDNENDEPNDFQKRLEGGHAAEAKNSTSVRDSYDTQRMAGGRTAERKGRQQTDVSTDSMGSRLRGLGGLRKRRGEPKLIKNR